jgi:serine/threonine-protein kinase
VWIALAPAACGDYDGLGCMSQTQDSDATSTASQAAPAPGSLAGSVLSGRYLIQAVLGEGGMGTVYLGEHTLMHKRVAIKVLHPEMMRMPEVVARFEREAMAAAHIEHPNVAAATDFGKLEDGSFFLVLEFVQGLSLREALEHGALASSRALHVARQIGSALVRAHGLGIVHRDLKPENVMLVERDGDADFVKVLDFGIAKVPVSEIVKDPGHKGQALTRAGMIYGTPEYMAPEQALGYAVDARADLYALGVILYEMLTGLRPFESDNPVTLLGLQVSKAPPSFAERAPLVRVAPGLEALVMRLLAKEAAGRPADAREVLEALDGCERTVEAAATPPAPAEAAQVATARTALDLVGPSSSAAAPAALVDPVPDRAPAAPMQRAAAAAVPVGDRIADLARRLPPPLDKVHPVAWIGGAGVAALVMVLGGALLLCRLASSGSTLASNAPAASQSSGAALSASAGASASAAPVRATDAELKSALAEGPDAVRKLADRYPTDPSALKALARSYMAATRSSEALGAYKRLLALDPAQVNEPEVGQNVVIAAQVEESADTAFAMLESDLGTRGVDYLYWLAYDSKAAAKYTLRAARALSRKEVRERGSPALRIACDLRAANGCEAKHRLLARARADADARTLRLLRPLFARKGCGFLKLGDCWKCMRQSTALADAVHDIEARTSDVGGTDDKEEK